MIRNQSNYDKFLNH